MLVCWIAAIPCGLGSTPKLRTKTLTVTLLSHGDEEPASGISAIRYLSTLKCGTGVIPVRESTHATGIRTLIS